MEQFDVKRNVDEGIGFVLAGHNYGRLDRLTDEELETAEVEARKIIDQAGALLSGIGIVEQTRYDEDTMSRSGQYAIE